MKLRLALLPMILMICAATPQTTDTKYAESRDMFRETMASGASMVAIMEEGDLEVVKIDMDLVCPKVSKQTLKMLSTNYTYIIAAVGQPSRIADLDVAVYYLNGENTTLVDKDEATDNNPTIKFKPYVAGTYLIQISAAKMKPGYEDAMGFYFLTVAHD